MHNCQSALQSWEWWLTVVIPALGRPRQEDYLEFKVRPLLESYFLSCGTIRLINTQVWSVRKTKIGLRIGRCLLPSLIWVWSLRPMEEEERAPKIVLWMSPMCHGIHMLIYTWKCVTNIKTNSFVDSACLFAAGIRIILLEGMVGTAKILKNAFWSPKLIGWQHTQPKPNPLFKGKRIQSILVEALKVLFQQQM